MRRALLVQLILFNSAFGFEVTTGDGKILLGDDNCGTVQTQISAIADWTRSLYPGRTCTPKLDTSKKTCTYDVMPCVPDHVKKYQGFNPKSDGPNCWNLALVMKGIVPALRYSTPAEMSLYMRPPLCRPLKNGEQKQAGDIGAIRAATRWGRQEYHGFVYISDSLAYSKNGYDRRSPYSIQTLDNVMETYHVPPDSECRQNEVAASSVDCAASASYFRCISINDYLSQTHDLPKALTDALTHVEDFEKHVSNCSLTGQPVQPTAKRAIFDSVQAVTKYLATVRGNPYKQVDDNERFVVSSLQLRVQALAEQLGINGESVFADQLSHLIYAINADNQALYHGIQPSSSQSAPNQNGN